MFIVDKNGGLLVQKGIMIFGVAMLPLVYGLYSEI